MKRARDGISIGKLSGAVGTFSNIPPKVEEKVYKKTWGLNRTGCNAGRAERQACRVPDNAFSDCSIC